MPLKLENLCLLISSLSLPASHVAQSLKIFFLIYLIPPFQKVYTSVWRLPITFDRTEQHITPAKYLHSYFDKRLSSLCTPPVLSLSDSTLWAPSPIWIFQNVSLQCLKCAQRQQITAHFLYSRQFHKHYKKDGEVASVFFLSNSGPQSDSDSWATHFVFRLDITCIVLSNLQKTAPNHLGLPHGHLTGHFTTDNILSSHHTSNKGSHHRSTVTRFWHALSFNNISLVRHQ